MTLNYQLTLDDFREAHLGVKPKASRGRRVGSLAGWVLFIGLAVTLWMLMRSKSAPVVAMGDELERPAAPLLHRMGAAMASTLVFGGLLSFFMLRQLFQPLPTPWTAPSPSEAAARTGKTTWRGLFGWVLFIGLSVMLFTLLQNRTPPAAAPSGGATQPPAPRARLTPADFAIGVLPWGVAGVLLVIVTRMASERNIRRMWEAQQFLHRPESLEVSSRGVRLTEALSVREYEWSYFPGYKETQNLFLLYVSPLAFYVIPKRAFGSEAEMEAFRGVLMSGVKEGQFLDRPSSFPVVAPGTTVPPPLPVPALPLSPADAQDARQG